MSSHPKVQTLSVPTPNSCTIQNVESLSTPQVKMGLLYLFHSRKDCEQKLG